MNKDWFEKETKKIDVPKRDVYTAIKNGINSGRKIKSAQKRKKKIKLSAILSTTAASLVLASGFVFAPMTNVLAKVPFLSAVYENVHSSVGSNLFASNLVTELDQKATAQGVDVTITSAYYDGNIIGVTFKAEGDQLSIEHMDEGNRPAGGLSYHLFDEKDRKQWGSGSPEITKAGDQFIGSIEFHNPIKELPKNFTLPLTFTHIADVNGTWKFDVPVEQIPTETIMVDKKTQSDDGSYKLHIDSIVKGKATTMLEYTYTVPLEEDSLNLTVFDDKKNRLSKSGGNLIKVEEKDDFVNKTYREIFTSPISEDAEYMTVYSETDLYDRFGYQILEKAAPFKIKSQRFDYQITVIEIQSSNGMLAIDYTIDNLVEGQIRDDILQNFVEFIQIIPKDRILKDESGELDMNKMIEHTIKSGKTKLINKNNMQYKSTFSLPKKMEVKDYSLIVPFRTLSSNDKPIKLEPLKIELQ